MEKQQPSITPPEKSEPFSAADTNSNAFASQSSAAGPGAPMYGGSTQQEQHHQAIGTDSSYSYYGQGSADSGDGARGGNFFGSQQNQQQPYPPYSSSSSSSPYQGGYPPSGGGAPYSSGYPPQSFGGYPPPPGATSSSGYPPQHHGNGNGNGDSSGGYHNHQGPGIPPSYGVYPPQQHSPHVQQQAGGPSNYYNSNPGPLHHAGAGNPPPPTSIRLQLINPKSIPSGFTVVMPEGIYVLARRPNKIDKEKWGEFIRQLNEELAKSPGSLAHSVSTHWIVNLATLGVASIAREALKSKALNKSLKLAECYNRAEFATWGIRVTVDVTVDPASVATAAAAAGADCAGGSSSAINSSSNGGMLSVGHRENRAARRAERRSEDRNHQIAPDILVTLVISRSD
ncbi:hypothetical protein IWW48_004021 [Coemansia sp. RSA 1200]|nr:hypothetical protein IWW48_004021 [Coemansia sp. RSA 1200]